MQKFFLRLFRLCFKLWPLKKGKGRLQSFGLKLLQGLTVKAECYNNTKFLLSFPRDDGWECLYFQSICEAGTTKVFNNLITDDTIFFDIGANIGWFSVLAGKKINSGQCHSFEPVPEIFAELKTNISLNNLSGKNIYLNQIAIGDKSRNIEVYTFDELAHGHSSIKNVYQAPGVKTSAEMITLDSYLEQQKIKKIDIIKLDVEGAEMMVLHGALNLLSAKFNPIWLIEMNEETSRAFGYKCEDLLKRILDFRDHSFFKVNKAWGNIYEMESINDFRHGDNVFCVPISRKRELNIINSFLS